MRRQPDSEMTEQLFEVRIGTCKRMVAKQLVKTCHCFEAKKNLDNTFVSEIQFGGFRRNWCDAHFNNVSGLIAVDFGKRS